MAPRSTTFTSGGGGGRGSRQNFNTGAQIKNVVTNLKNIFEGLKQKQIKDALIEMGELIVKETTPFVPVGDGSLRDSWQVTPDDNPNNPKVLVTYGGITRTPGINAPGGFVDYAVEIHEDVSRSYAIGSPKFLDQGVAIARGQFEAIMAKHVRKALK